MYARQPPTAREQNRASGHRSWRDEAGRSRETHAAYAPTADRGGRRATCTAARLDCAFNAIWALTPARVYQPRRLCYNDFTFFSLLFCSTVVVNFFGGNRFELFRIGPLAITEGEYYYY